MKAQERTSAVTPNQEVRDQIVREMGMRPTTRTTPAWAGADVKKARAERIARRLDVAAGSVGKTVGPAASSEDSLALVRLYNDTGGSGWDNRSGWLSATVASWHGVTVDSSGRVVRLRLPGNSLFGFLPGAVGDLTALETLDLSDNFLIGGIPAGFGGLERLVYLDLSQNVLSGPIPSDLGALSQLTDLRLWGNILSGPIPEGLGGLSELRNLWLFVNRLTGEIPASLGSLANLERLYFDHNGLTGPIPAGLGNLSELTELFLDANQLTGEIPLELADLSKLVLLFLSENGLTGGIPAELGRLSNLQVLSLSANPLGGTLPDAIGAMPMLSYLYASYVQLSGAIPEGITFAPLVNLYLRGNAFSGDLPEYMARLSFMSQLDLADNQLTGELPEALTVLSGLNRLDLSRNAFSGNLPEEIGRMQGLTHVRLQGNSFSGELPASVEALQRMRVLDLSENEFTGALPAAIGSLIGLDTLRLRHNDFTGEIPPSFGQIAFLRHLDLSDNRLSGSVPSSLANLPMLRALLLGRNRIENLPDLSRLAALDTVDVSHNRLSFDDLERNMGLAGGAFSYAPQDTLPTVRDRNAAEAIFSVTAGGSRNEYRWLRNGEPVGGAVRARLALTAADASTSSDLIYAEVTSPLVPALTLMSRPSRADAVLGEAIVTPDSVRVELEVSARFSVAGTDQFGQAYDFRVYWSAEGGHIDSTGLFTAGTEPGLFAVTATDGAGEVHGQAVVFVQGAIISTESEEGVPSAIVLHPNYPNPFNPSTFIAFELPTPADVSLRVYGVDGREVAVVATGVYAAGVHRIRFDAPELPSGLYFYRLEGRGIRTTRAMVLAK